MQYRFVNDLPPAARRGRKSSRNQKRGVHERFANALRAKPGIWAKFPSKLKLTTRYSYVTYINSGRLPAFAEPGFEAAVRGGELHVRWVPTENDTAA